MHIHSACLLSWWTQYKLADPPEWCIYCNRSVNIMLGIMRLMIVKDEEAVINNLEYLTAACSHEAPGGWEEAAKCSKSVHLYFVQTTDCRAETVFRPLTAGCCVINNCYCCCCHYLRWPVSPALSRSETRSDARLCSLESDNRERVGWLPVLNMRWWIMTVLLYNEIESEL